MKRMKIYNIYILYLNILMEGNYLTLLVLSRLIVNKQLKN